VKETSPAISKHLEITICDFSAIKIVIMSVYYDVALCSLADIDQHFRGAYCLQHQGDESISTTLCGLMSQKTVIFTLVAVRT
jgi:hypothetical protein